MLFAYFTPFIPSYLGGALALHYSLRATHGLAGCVALSTWLPLRSDYPAVLSDSSRALPILQVHGDEDMVVNYAWGVASNRILSSLITSPAPEFVTIEGMAHSSDPEEMEKVRSFIVTHLGP